MSGAIRALGGFILPVENKSDPADDQWRLKRNPFLERNAPPRDELDPDLPMKDGDDLLGDMKKGLEEELAELERLGKDESGKWSERLRDAFENWEALTAEQYQDMLNRYEKIVPKKKPPAPIWYGV